MKKILSLCFFFGAIFTFIPFVSAQDQVSLELLLLTADPQVGEVMNISLQIKQASSQTFPTLPRGIIFSDPNAFQKVGERTSQQVQITNGNIFSVIEKQWSYIPLDVGEFMIEPLEIGSVRSNDLSFSISDRLLPPPDSEYNTSYTYGRMLYIIFFFSLFLIGIVYLFYQRNTRSSNTQQMLEEKEESMDDFYISQLNQSSDFKDLYLLLQSFGKKEYEIDIQKKRSLLNDDKNMLQYLDILRMVEDGIFDNSAENKDQTHAFEVVKQHFLTFLHTFYDSKNKS